MPGEICITAPDLKIWFELEWGENMKHLFFGGIHPKYKKEQKKKGGWKGRPQKGKVQDKIRLSVSASVAN